MKFNPKKQASYLLKPKTLFGVSRQSAKMSGRICSKGTLRVYENHLTQFIDYIYTNQICKPNSVTAEIALSYLEERAKKVVQKTLDADRQSLQMTFGLRLNFVVSQCATHLNPRSYLKDEIQKIMTHQNCDNRLATEIASACGLRAHELATILRINEQPVSKGRNWPDDMFAGLEPFVLYSVKGKGGLVRPIAMPVGLAEKLELRQLQTTKTISDRGIFYSKNYEIGSGQNWSQSFSAACKKEHHFSHGAHGLRHSYAQRRLLQLIERGKSVSESKKIVSAELGHFRESVINVYLH